MKLNRKPLRTPAARPTRKPLAARKPQRGASRKRERAPLAWGLWKQRALLVLAAVLLGSVVTGAVLAGDRLLSIPADQVGFSGDMKYVDRASLIKAVEPHLGVGFFRLDLEAVSADVRKLAWVEDVQISRHWPRRVLVTITEQRPIARWGDTALINYRGEIFTPRSVADFDSLPVLHGPSTQSQAVMERFLALSEQLDFVDLQFSSLSLDAQGSWSGELDNGMKLRFGAGEMKVKLQRFIKVYRTALEPRAAEVAAVDMRYSNGLAVAWRDAQPRRS